jgi:putative transposase
MSVQLVATVRDSDGQLIEYRATFSPINARGLHVPGGIGHGGEAESVRQMILIKTHWRHRLCYGGRLRQERKGRGTRPLSTREPLHLVLKARRERIKTGFRVSRRFQLIHELLTRYSKRFYIKVEQISIQGDHLHLLIRTSRRSNYQSFFRVFSGQIAQRFELEGLLTPVTDTPLSPTSGTSYRTKKIRIRMPGLWLLRPFTRVVRSYRAYVTVRNYIQLNEQEALGRIRYQPRRLRGLSTADWEILWS